MIFYAYLVISSFKSGVLRESDLSFKNCVVLAVLEMITIVLENSSLSLAPAVMLKSDTLNALGYAVSDAELGVNWTTISLSGDLWN